jgi:hypothetical protein
VGRTILLEVELVVLWWKSIPCATSQLLRKNTTITREFSSQDSSGQHVKHYDEVVNRCCALVPVELKSWFLLAAAIGFT